MTAGVQTTRNRAATVSAQPSWRKSRLRAFLVTPMAWLLLTGIGASVAAEARYRGGHYQACAAGSMLVDRQTFREGIATATRSEIGLIQSCLGQTVPQTWDVARARRLLEEQPNRLFDWMY